MAYPRTDTAVPGWATPRGSDDGLYHWWRTDGRRACDPANSWAYDGPKVDPQSIDPMNTCLVCDEVVEDAKAVLGTEIASR